MVRRERKGKFRILVSVAELLKLFVSFTVELLVVRLGFWRGLPAGAHAAQNKTIMHERISLLSMIRQLARLALFYALDDPRSDAMKLKLPVIARGLMMAN
jgi:hypothetical protein